MSNPIPPGHVKITRFPRVGPTVVWVLPDAEARKLDFAYGSVSLEYPDGLLEDLDLNHTPVRFYSSAAASTGAPLRWSRALGPIGYYGPTANRTTPE